MSGDIVVAKGQGAWLEITITRPEKRNAIREQTARELLSALESAESDAAVRGVIILGAEGTFCAGVDTSEFTNPEGGAFEIWRQRRTSRQISKLFRTMPEFTKPCIACVEGLALGGGFELALMCDIIVAARDAQFALPEVKLGILPGGGGTQTLTRLIGRAAAKEMIWTGKRISGERAEQMGIVTIAETGATLERARSLVSEIVANAPLPIMFAKALVDQAADCTLRQGYMQEGDLAFALSFSTDRKEGLAAFKEKRKPQFNGR